MQLSCKKTYPVVCSGFLSYFCKSKNPEMHQSIFHKLCLRIALWAVVVFSLAGYHHHEATHICLGWEHLMLHNHCQKGINCLPTDTSAQDTPCHCHSGKILGLEKNSRQSIQQPDAHPVKFICCTPSEYPFVIQEYHSNCYPSGNSPRGPCPEFFSSHGLRAPPVFVF